MNVFVDVPAKWSYLCICVWYKFVCLFIDSQVSSPTHITKRKAEKNSSHNMYCFKHLHTRLVSKPSSMAIPTFLWSLVLASDFRQCDDMRCNIGITKAWVCKGLWVFSTRLDTIFERHIIVFRSFSSQYR